MEIGKVNGLFWVEQIGKKKTRPRIPRFRIGNEKDVVRKNTKTTARMMQAQSAFDAGN
jgi:hypothetical protein